MSEIANITIDDRFWEVAARQSSRYDRLWTIAKETIQNSVDAKANRIDFWTDADPEWVTVQDDGEGMGLTGGIQNFLRLGKSQKQEQANTTGYFSSAKVRICFIHKNWKIRSDHQYLTKSMLGKEPIGHSEERIEGTQIAVQSANGPWEPERIREYVGLCSVPADVFVDGERLPKTYRRGTEKADLGWAKIYINKGEKAQRETMVVRINGLAMFTRRLWGVPAQITVELAPEWANEFLQENREDFVYSTKWNGSYVYPAQKLDELVQGMIINPRTTAREKEPTIELVKGRSGSPWERRQSAARDGVGTEAVYAMQPTTMAGFDLDDVVRIAQGVEIETVPVTAGEVCGEMYRLTFPNGMVEWADSVEEANQLVAEQENVPDLEPTAWDEYFPWDWVQKYDGRPDLNLDRDVYPRILRGWLELARKGAELAGISEPFGVGLIVDADSDANAEWCETAEGNWLLIDPRTVSVRETRQSLIGKLVLRASHELAHAQGYHSHDERFVSEQTRIFGLIMGETLWLKRNLAVTFYPSKWRHLRDEGKLESASWEVYDGEVKF